MRRLRFSTDLGSVRFDRKAPAALAILQLLKENQKKSLTVKAIVDSLVNQAGVLMHGLDEQHVSCLLQRLMACGAIGHPAGRGATRHYILRRWPKIDLL